MKRPHPCLATCATFGCLLLTSGDLFAQRRVVIQNGVPVVTDGQSPTTSPQPGAAPQLAPGAPAQPNPKKPGADGQKPGEAQPKPGTPKPDDTPKTTKRPTTPPVKPDPKELEASPDAEGMIRFNFNGQPWPDVLEWLAKVSGLSLDWQELPADYLNLSTRRRYTVAEARDLINRHLLARGFTLLRNGEVLSVANIKKLNIGMVPRCEPEELAQRDPYEFVKVSFPLESLVAESAAEEFKPMMSPNGTLTALKATNRLEAIDAVVNLREIYRLLKEEQTLGTNEYNVRRFPLQYTRAADVVELLKSLLGMSKPPAPPMSPQQVQQMQQLMQQQAQLAKKGKPEPKSKSDENTQLVADKRQNCVLAYAAPDTMAIIAQAIELLDVSNDDANSLLRNLDRMQVYRLSAIDPNPLVKVLREVGDLDPSTTLEVDEKSKAIIAYARPVDHATIQFLIDKLDGSSRRFEVIRLRLRQAELVAGTIQTMFGLDEKDNNSQNSSYYGYSRYYDGGSQQKKNKMNEFRVDADIEHNQLLLWANDMELEEVNELLVKLGERPREGNPSRVRIIEPTPGNDVEELLERLKKLWPNLYPNELILPETGKESKPTEQPDGAPRAGLPANNEISHAPHSAATSPKPEPNSSAVDDIANAQTTGDEVVRAQSPPAKYLKLLQFSRDETEAATTPDSQTETPDAPDAKRASPPADFFPNVPGARNARGNRSQTPAPITVKIGPDGRLILDSDDTRALDLLEDVISDLTPRPTDYKIFQLKHRSTWPYTVATNLEDFFKSEDGDEGGMRYDPYYGRYYAPSTVDRNRRLSNRRPLRFIPDDATNTILVQGADPEQLKIIEELIELYDRADPPDSSSVRKTKVFKIRYSKAQVIAEAVKDVYRDLLSQNDKALATGKDKEKETVVERSYSYIYGNMENDKEAPDPIRFKGLLSVGVDDLSNTLIISATDMLMHDVSDIIEMLDTAAKPNSAVEVINVQRRINAGELQKKLSNLVGPPPPPSQQQPQKPGEQGPGQQPPAQPNGSGTPVLQVR